MSQPVTLYRVFIASPGGMPEERKAFREIVLQFNKDEAIHRGAVFLPIGWEDTLGGIGRPQATINAELRQCDYCVVMFHDRWGSPTACGDEQFTSGTEEEFYVAQECMCGENASMRGLVVLFKAVAANKLADPGAELRPVLDFRKALEKQHLYHTFDDLRSFDRHLRSHLSEWLRWHGGKGRRADPKTARFPPLSSAGRSIAHGDEIPAEPAWLKEVDRLLDAGQRTDAEILLADTIAESGGSTPLLAYGDFLRSDGRLTQAKQMYEDAVELRGATGRELAAAVTAIERLQDLVQRIGTLNRAETLYRDFLERAKSMGGGRKDVSLEEIMALLQARQDGREDRAK